MVNPMVYNSDRSESFLAVVIDDVIRARYTSFDKATIEAAVKQSGVGSTVAGRYFLRQDATASTWTLSGMPKKDLCKRRCCSISKKLIDDNALQALLKGLFNSYIMRTSCMLIFTIFSDGRYCFQHKGP